MACAAAARRDDPFLLVNGDIWTDYDFARLPREPAGLAHLVMVDRPGHATHGDFALDEDGQVRADGATRLTYAGLGIYRPQLLDGWQDITARCRRDGDTPRFRLAPILQAHPWRPAGSAASITAVAGPMSARRNGWHGWMPSSTER